MKYLKGTNAKELEEFFWVVQPKMKLRKEPFPGGETQSAVQSLSVIDGISH